LIQAIPDRQNLLGGRGVESAVFLLHNLDDFFAVHNCHLFNVLFLGSSFLKKYQGCISGVPSDHAALVFKQEKQFVN